jgi:hypothetical protein
MCASLIWLQSCFQTLGSQVSPRGGKESDFDTHRPSSYDGTNRPPPCSVVNSHRPAVCQLALQYHRPAVLSTVTALQCVNWPCNITALQCCQPAPPCSVSTGLAISPPSGAGCTSRVLPAMQALQALPVEVQRMSRVAHWYLWLPRDRNRQAPDEFRRALGRCGFGRCSWQTICGIFRG